MIKILDKEGIAFTVGDGAPVLVTVADSIEGLRNGDPMARLELIAWGFLAAYNDHEKDTRARMDDVLAKAPNIESVFQMVTDKFPAFLNSLGVEAPATNREVRPSNLPKPDNGGS
jgi:hypothetical protein